jgi:NAD(P)-dependent dehydrogenase (short-subunit alcohol dehydrogenase family)
MDLELRNKTALVTGSTAGIGFGIASLLAQEGAAVLMNGRSQRRVDEGIERIRQKQKDAHVTGVAADLGTREGIDKLTSAVPEIDILVNNLGIFEAKPFSEITADEWLRFFEINVMSGVRLSRFYLPGMLNRNWGRIVFISSESALNIPIEMIHYGVTVALIFRVKNAIDLANDSPYGLGGSVITKDVERGKRIARQIETGMVFINRATWTAPDLPFGGVKNSGYGRELSDLGIGEFVNKKLIRVA